MQMVHYKLTIIIIIVAYCQHEMFKQFQYLNNLIRWNKFKKLPAKERKFCKTCGIPIEKDDNDHQSHIILNEVQDKLLTRPTSLLEPITENKGIAVNHNFYKFRCIYLFNYYIVNHWGCSSS